VSAGGNSSTKCDIKLDIENLEKFINYLSNLLKFKESIEGQRRLMTSALREEIKTIKHQPTNARLRHTVSDKHRRRHCLMSRIIFKTKEINE